MKQPTDTGMNRTGMGMAPKLKDGMLSSMKETHPAHKNGGMDLSDMRMEYLHNSPGIGSTPSPSTAKGAFKAGMQAIKGNKPSVFLDKLGERLAFERTGTRLYEAVIAKHGSEGSWDGGPTSADLQRFHDEERQHFEMLHEAIETMGGDPTTMTPSADVAGVASEGVMKVITDPRSSLDESLEALLIAELADHDGWEMLIHLADGMGQSDLADRFRQALAEEDEHLASVRNWLTSGLEQQAGTD